MPRAQRDYFIPWLIVLLQRQCLLRLIQDCADTSANREHDVDSQDRLADRSVTFDLEANFSHASWRPAIQEHYELARQTHRVAEGIQSVRRAIESFEWIEADRQREQTEASMHGLEMMIATVYSAELAHLFSAGLFGPSQSGHSGHLDWGHLGALAGVAFLTFLIIKLVLHGHQTSHEHSSRSRSPRRIWTTFGLLSIVQALALTVQWWFHRH